ncbi:MAG: hypothetical protein HY296_00310 [Thaumarchaeota archaeon]|nr:hypothetical protein [Nitrososphaerota archaeon]
MSDLLWLAIALYTVNAGFFGFLAYVYGKTAFSTKATYAAGLFIFSLLLLVHSAGTAAAYLLLQPYFLEEAVPFMALMGSVELVGVVALLKITL